MKVSVIIPALEVTQSLKKCLDRLERQSFPRNEFEIIVVFNGKTKPRFRKKGVQVLHEKRTGSYAARNAGIQKARGHVIAFTDSDCIPDLNWLQNGISTARYSWAAGCVKVVDDSAVSFYESHFVFNQKHFVSKYSAGATCNLFVPKKIFSKVGLFDERLKSGGDFEWCQRATRGGFKGIYCDRAVVQHESRKTFQKLAEQHRRLVGGFFDFHRRSFSRAGCLVLTPLAAFPSLTAVPSFIRNSKISWRSKKDVLAISMGLAGVRTLEFARLMLGGESRRA